MSNNKNTQLTASNAGERDKTSAEMNLSMVCQEIEYARDHGWPHECRGRLESLAKGVRLRAALASKPPAVDWSQAGRLMEAAMTAKAAGFTVGTTNWAAHICRAMGGKPPAGEQKPARGVRCARCGCSSAEACNAEGCFFLEGGNGEPPPEQVAQDKIDAERYRWLRAHNDLNDFGVSFAYPIDSDWRPALDVAIDAARTRGEGERNAG